MHCNYQQLSDGRWRCPQCGDATSTPRAAPPLRVCQRPLLGPPPPPPPSLFARLTRFAPAAIRHVLGGSPTCTQEQIDARLAICRACPGDAERPEGYWIQDAENPNLGVCAKCGCQAGREEKFLNKLAWADQECPIAAWGKIGGEDGE